MLALQIFETFFVWVKVLETKSWGRPGLLQAEASRVCHGLQVSLWPPLVSQR